MVQCLDRFGKCREDVLKFALVLLNPTFGGFQLVPGVLHARVEIVDCVQDFPKSDSREPNRGRRSPG